MRRFAAIGVVTAMAAIAVRAASGRVLLVGVIIDGTKSGSPACSARKAAQNFGPSSGKGPLGLNGIMIWKADDVWVQNVTVCNFLAGAGGDGGTGNEIWWNGGDGSGVADGFFGNPTNGDFALTNFEPGPTDCFGGNVEQGGAAVKSIPSNAQQLYPVCNGQTVPPSQANPQSGQFTQEVLCDSQVSLSPGAAPPCQRTDHYPRVSKVVVHRLPKGLKSMPNPCAGVPANPWCRHK
jgi:hypothetical protein